MQNTLSLVDGGGVSVMGLRVPQVPRMIPPLRVVRSEPEEVVVDAVDAAPAGNARQAPDQWLFSYPPLLRDPGMMVIPLAVVNTLTALTSMTLEVAKNNALMFLILMGFPAPRRAIVQSRTY